MTFTPFPSGSRPRVFADSLVDALRRLWVYIASTDFVRGMRLSMIGVYALVLRDATTRFGHRSAGAVWVMMAPLLRLGGMILLFNFLGRGPAAGDSLVIFFLTGMVPVFLLRAAVTSAGSAIRSGGAMMTFPQIGPLEFVASRVWVELLSDAGVVFIIMMGAKAFGGLAIAAWFSEPLKIVGAVIMLAYFTYAASFLSAQLGRLWQQWTDITRFIARALFFTSGVWYTMGSLPPNLRGIIQYNPVAHIIEWVRDGVIHGFDSDYYTIGYPFWFATVCLFIGLFINLMYRLGGYDMKPGV